MSKTDERYLGDGVYAKDTGFYIVLRTDSGDTIYLEDTVIAAFARFIREVGLGWTLEEKEEEL